MATITFVFESGNNIPLYKQLYNFIKNEIKAGNLLCGERLPSKRILASHLKISQNTVETAYSQLTAEGYIKSVPKSGYFVCALEGLFPGTDNTPDFIKFSQHNLQTYQYKFDFKTNVVDNAFFPFATWARISKEIMHDENRDLLKMTDPQGDLLLRESIAKYLHEFRGVTCLPEQIIIGAGTEYLLGLIIQILGKECIYAVENPGYYKTHRILKSHDRDVTFISLDENGIKVKELEESHSNIVYITPSHHFPLGIIMPVNRRMQLLRWANQSGDRYIIEDDYDSEFRFNGRPIPALQGLDRNNKVIYISTFSKIIAPSIRISYMVLPVNLLELYQKSFLFYSSTVSRFEQSTLYRFIKDGHFERHLNRMRNIYRTRKDKLVEEIKKLPFGSHIEIIGENTGLHLLLKVNGAMKEKELVNRAEAVGIKLYGLSGYYLQQEDDTPDNIVVLGYSNFTTQEIEEAVNLLKVAWATSF